MRKSFKTALCTILGICIIAAVLTGCAQAGNERALGPNGANNGYNNGMNNGAQNQGLTRNNLVGGRYGTNRNTGYTGITGTNRNTGNTGNTGYTGYNGMFGINRRNMAGSDGNTGNNPSNYLSNNGINTIEYNNRFGRMGNNGTGTGNYGYGSGYNGMLTGNTGYGSGYNGMLTGNTGYGSGYNGMLTGNTGYGSGYNGMLTGNTAANGMNSNDRVRATMIERRLNNVNGINNCSVIVSGDKALVGLRTTGANTGNISRLRTSIERRVKQIDSSIKNVTVTDSPKILTRMGRLGTTGNYNATTNNFMQEFDNMINSINHAGR